LLRLLEFFGKEALTFWVINAGWRKWYDGAREWTLIITCARWKFLKEGSHFEQQASSFNRSSRLFTDFVQ
jgi:hypothetical protein